jgi:hypothetical protein
MRRRYKCLLAIATLAKAAPSGYTALQLIHVSMSNSSEAVVVNTAFFNQKIELCLRIVNFYYLMDI